MENAPKKYFSWPLLILMASITYSAILSELMPSGVLPEMAQGFHISQAQAGGFVGQYAIASSCCGLPLIALTVEWDRKKLLAYLIFGFALANFITGLTSSYWLAVVARLLGGLCAGVLWPMISAYGMMLVPTEKSGLAVSVIMAGTTVGMSLGLPLMTAIGRYFSYQVEFVVMGACIALIGVLCHFFLPHVPGEKRSRANSPLTMLKNKGVLLVGGMTALAAIANYGMYTYITNLVSDIHYPGIGVAQILFGVGSVLSVLFAAYFIDRHLRFVTLTMLGSAAVAMALFSFTPVTFLHHLSFILWGIGFGALVTLFQTAVTRQVHDGVAVATSVQSACFNFSIMIGTSLSGWLLTMGSSLTIAHMAIIVLVADCVVATLAQETLAH